MPYNDMWPDDKYWLPMLLDGKNFTGSFLFGGKNDDVLKYKIKEI
jgi:8-oxo-dGTP diphosphatase